MKATRSAYVAHLGLAEGRGARTTTTKAKGTAKRTVTLGQVLRWTFGVATLVAVLGPLLT